MAETYVIGDLHGCYETLLALQDQIAVEPHDRLIFLGDLIDRGPRIREVLDFVLYRPNTIVLQGNHEFAFVDYFRRGGRRRSAPMLARGLQETLEQLGPRAAQYAFWLGGLPTSLRSANGAFVYCHADWNWRGERFDPARHLWTRINRQADTHADYAGPVIVHGHSPVDSGKILEMNADGRVIGINLDGGCVYRHGWSCLRAMRESDGAFFEEPVCD